MKNYSDAEWQAKRKQIADALYNTYCRPDEDPMQVLLRAHPEITDGDVCRYFMEDLEQQGRIVRTGEFRDGLPLFVSVDHVVKH